MWSKDSLILSIYYYRNGPAGLVQHLWWKNYDFVRRVCVLNWRRRKKTHLYKCKLLAKDSHIYEYLVLPQFAATSGSVSLGKVHCFPDRQIIWYLVYRVPYTRYPGVLKKARLVGWLYTIAQEKHDHDQISFFNE